MTHQWGCHVSEGHVIGGLACQGGAHQGWHGISLGGFDFGPDLVDGWQQGGVWQLWGQGKPKVSLLVKPLELQYYFVPFQNQRSD